MIELIVSCALLAISQQSSGETKVSVSASWREFYEDGAGQYEVTRASDRQPIRRMDHAVFEWASINEYHGGVFAWTENGRPVVLSTIFSFPLQGSQQRLAVHEFASFADVEVVVNGPGEVSWRPAPLRNLQRVPNASPPPAAAGMLKLQCRRLAKEFSAHMNRRGERWDLRLLPTPLVEYQQSSPEVLGGGLFTFVGYSTDPEVLLLLEAQKTRDGPAWHFQPVRFSDKSLYLKYQDKPIWESLRTGHGTDAPDTEDALYRVLSSERIPPEVMEPLSAQGDK